MPPKPKELRARSGPCAAWPAWARGRCRSLRRVVEVEGRRHDLVAHREDREDRLDRAGGAQQMADRRLGRGHRELVGVVAEQALHRAQLDLVAQRRRGAVRVDVVDLVGVELGALQRRLHGAVAAVAVLRRRGDVIGVARQAVAHDLGIDLGAALLGVLVLFEHDDAGALAHDEAVAVLVPRPRGRGRRVVEAGRQRAQAAKPAMPMRQIAASAPPATITSASLQLDQARGVADRMGAGRAGRDHRVVRALEAVLDRDLAGGEVDQRRGDEERARCGAAPSPSAMIDVSSIVCSPPMPEPISTPVRSRPSSSVGFQPESSTACCAAAMPKTMKSSIFRWSLGAT